MWQSLNRPCTADCTRQQATRWRTSTPCATSIHIFLFLVIVGGLNWLLVGLAKFDLVAALTGQTFGETNLISSVIYVLVGVSAIGLIPTLIRWVARPEEPALA